MCNRKVIETTDGRAINLTHRDGNSINKTAGHQIGSEAYKIDGWRERDKEYITESKEGIYIKTLTSINKTRSTIGNEPKSPSVIAAQALIWLNPLKKWQS